VARAIPPEELKVHVLELPKVRAELENMEAQITELYQERDFWRNEYEELLACIGGTDPRH
jgi:flagellar biosynthesis chaperone FliJ